MNRKIYFEFMRIIACALVIFNHINGYKLYTISSGGMQIFYMSLTMITRINVPIFFMISGALLLKKDEDVISVFRKRVSKIALLLLIFQGVAYFTQPISKINAKTGDSTIMGDFFRTLLKGSLSDTVAYWYLYAYLGFLCVLPMMQRIAKGFTKQEFYVILSIHFLISSFLPILNVILKKFGMLPYDISDKFNVPFATVKALFYTLIGYYLEHEIDIEKIKKKHVILLIFGGLLGIGLSNYCTLNEARIKGSCTQNYVQLFDYLLAIVVFILIKALFVNVLYKKDRKLFNKIICYIGSLTLGIYLIDPILRRTYYSDFKVIMEPIAPTIIVSLGWILFSMIVGGLITAILKKVPGIKKLI